MNLHLNWYGYTCLTGRQDEGLIERQKINKFQEEFVDCLLYVFAKHRGEDAAGKTFAKIMHVLTQSRSASKWKVDLVEKVIDTYKDMQLSQLVMEIFNIHTLENIHITNEGNESVSNIGFEHLEACGCREIEYL